MLTGLLRTADGQCQGVQPAREFVGQNGVNHALALDPGLAGERLGRDLHGEMGLPAGPRSGVSMMAVGIVDDVQFCRHEGPGEFFAKNVDYRHGPGPSFESPAKRNLTAHPDGRRTGGTLVMARANSHTLSMVRPISTAEYDDRDARRCDREGCAGEGLYRAPRGRDDLTSYYWFCLDHVRDYNKAWNFYEGMTVDQIEILNRADLLGGRPTWPLGSRAAWTRYSPKDLWEEARAYLRGSRAERAEAKRQRAEAPEAAPREAMGVFGLDGPLTGPAVKGRYKELVKRYHPDANGGDKKAEERLKDINRAYAVLKAFLRA